MIRCLEQQRHALLLNILSCRHVYPLASVDYLLYNVFIS
jgi:hypothetical protein